MTEQARPRTEAGRALHSQKHNSQWLKVGPNSHHGPDARCSLLAAIVAIEDGARAEAVERIRQQFADDAPTAMTSTLAVRRMLDEVASDD